MAEKTIETFIVEFLMRQSPETKRAIQQLERGFQQLQRGIRGTLQRAGFAIDDFSDDVSDMSRESRADLERTGRATDELSRDVADMSMKTRRELDKAEDAYGDLGDKAKGTARMVGGALAAIGGTFALKETEDFRVMIARIDNQLEAVTFDQAQRAVLGVSDALNIARNEVVMLGRQLPDSLVNTPEQFEARLLEAAKVYKSVGDDVAPIEVANLLNLANTRLIEEKAREFVDQLVTAIDKAPVLRERFDEIQEGLTEAITANVETKDFFAAFVQGSTGAGRDLSGTALPELFRSINEAKEKGQTITLEDLLAGDTAALQDVTDAAKEYLRVIHAEGDALAKFADAQADIGSATGRLDRNIANISEATGGFNAMLNKMSNLMVRVGGYLTDLLGGFVGLLPAVGGAALALQAFGLDLSGVGKAIKGFASAVRHPVRSLQRFWAWLLTSTTGLRTFATNLWASGTASLGSFATAIRTNVIPALSRFAATIWTSSVGALKALATRLAIASWATLRFAGRAIVAGIAGVFAFAASIWTGAVPALATFAAGVWATTVAMLANPVGLIVLGIVALIAALVLLVKHWDTVKRVVRDFFNRYGNYVLAALAVVAPFIAVPLLIAKNWNRIVEIVGGIWSRVNDTARGWIQAIIDFVRELPGRVVGILKDIPGMVADAIRDIPGLGVALEAFTGIAGKVGKAVGFAEGGIVPGPLGRPLLATVHGGEMVLPPGASNVLAQMFEGFRLGPAALPQAPPGYGQMYRSSVVTRSVTVNIVEPIVIQTQATDAKGIAQELGEAIQDQIRNVAYDHDGPVER